MESFEELAAKYESMIYHVIHSLNIYKNRDEFFQIGLIALWEAYKRFDPDKGNFGTYAYSFIKGRMMTELGKQSKDDERHVYPAEEVFWEMKAYENGQPPLQLPILLSYCHGLSPKQKLWVVYTFYYGMTVKEIAEAEKVSLSAVKKWKAGAMEKIKMNMKGGLCR
jgi:DNA-directed RNA polymerase